MRAVLLIFLSRLFIFVVSISSLISLINKNARKKKERKKKKNENPSEKDEAEEEKLLALHMI